MSIVKIVVGLIFLLTVIQIFRKYRRGFPLSSLEKTALIATMLGFALLLVDFAQDNDWISKPLPMPPLWIVAYFLLAICIIMIKFVPQFDPIRQYYDGRFVRSGLTYRLIKTPSKERLLTKRKQLDFLKTVKDLADTKFPQTQRILIGELRQKLLLVCEEGNHWGKKTRSANQNLLDVIEDNFDSENQRYYVELLSIMVSRKDEKTNNAVRTRMKDKVHQLWNSPSANTNLDLLAILNIILYLQHYSIETINKMTETIMHDSDKKKFDALLSSLKEHGIFELKRSKTINAYADFLLKEACKSEEKKDHNAFKRVSELRRLVKDS